MFRKPNSVSEWIALVLVPLVSILHIIMQIAGGFNPSFIVTVLGFAFVLTFLLNIKIYTYVFITWAISQLVIVKFPLGNQIFELSQLISLGVGMNFNNHFYIGIGLPGIFYTALAIRVKMDSIYGMKIRLLPLKNDLLLQQILPADAVIIRRISLGESSSWYLVKFIDSQPLICAIIRGKHDYLIRSGEKQLVEFWKIEDPEWILNSSTIERKLLRSPGKAVIE